MSRPARVVAASFIGCSVFNAVAATPFAIDDRGFRWFNGETYYGWDTFWACFVSGYAVVIIGVAVAALIIGLIDWVSAERSAE